MENEPVETPTSDGTAEQVEAAPVETPETPAESAPEILGETPAEPAVETPAEAPAESTETEASAEPDASASAGPAVTIVADGVGAIGTPPAPAPADPALATPEAVIAHLKEAHATKMAAQASQEMTEDQALGVETIPAGGKVFKLKIPSIFGRRDMLVAMAAMAGDAKIANDETDELKKLQLSAEVFTQQIKVVLPCLEIMDPSTMQFRPSELNEAGYALDDASLAKVMAGILAPTTAEAELKAAGIDTGADPKEAAPAAA